MTNDCINELTVLCLPKQMQRWSQSLFCALQPEWKQYTSFVGPSAKSVPLSSLSSMSRADTLTNVLHIDTTAINQRLLLTTKRTDTWKWNNSPLGTCEISVVHLYNTQSNRLEITEVTARLKGRLSSAQYRMLPTTLTWGKQSMSTDPIYGTHFQQSTKHGYPNYGQQGTHPFLPKNGYGYHPNNKYGLTQYPPQQIYNPLTRQYEFVPGTTLDVPTNHADMMYALLPVGLATAGLLLGGGQKQKQKHRHTRTTRDQTRLRSQSQSQSHRFQSRSRTRSRTQSRSRTRTKPKETRKRQHFSSSFSS